MSEKTPVLNQYQKEFCYRLRVKRFEKNLTLEKIASAVKITPSSVYDWEFGSRLPSYDKLNTIFDVLGLSPKERIEMERLRRGLPAEVDHKFKMETLIPELPEQST